MIYFQSASGFPLGSDPKWWHDVPNTPGTITGKHEIYRWKFNSPDSLPPFIRTLAADGIVYPSIVIDAVKRIDYHNGDAECSEEMLRAIFRGQTVGNPSLHDMFRSLSPTYLRQVQQLFKVFDGRRFFVTNTGHIGLAPDVATTGDSVLVLQGCSIPFIPRELPPTKLDGIGEIGAATNINEESSMRGLHHMNLVGESWVYGIEEGSIFDKEDNMASNICSEEIMLH
jgi:hypothetical protein